MGKKIILILLIILMFISDLRAGPKKGKFRVEVFGGISFVNPDDLNAYPRVWEKYLDFRYRQSYEYYVSVGYIRSFEFSQEGEFETIKMAIPLGLRIRWNVFKYLSFSLGLKYISASASSPIDVSNRIILNDGTIVDNQYLFSKFNISTRGWIPQLGLHFEKKLNPRTGLELYAIAGLITGKCQIRYDYNFEQREDEVISSSSFRSLQMEGKGQGTNLEVFLRLNHLLGRSLGFFIETGYVYQKIDNLEGAGKLDENGALEEWEGNWGMKEYYSADYWGQFYELYPSSSWEFPEDKRWARYFHLDLSGFQIRIGFTFRF
jgi:hypothetical protein